MSSANTKSLGVERSKPLRAPGDRQALQESTPRHIVCGSLSLTGIETWQSPCGLIALANVPTLIKLRLIKLGAGQRRGGDSGSIARPETLLAL